MRTMSDFKQITSENKERLMTLVNKVANYVREGVEPTDALTKAAAEGDYPADYILRAAEAYNGAAHLSHFKAAARDERGNSFPLADGYEATRRVMEKAAQLQTNVQHDEFAYLKESKSYFDVSIEDDFLFTEKQAGTPPLNKLMKQASMLENKEKLAIANAQLAYSNACESLARSIEAFHSKTANATEHRRAYWAKELLERHGKEALDVISLATRVTGAECEKIASQTVGIYSLGVEYIDDLDSIVRNYKQSMLFGEKLAQAECDSYVNKLERDRLIDGLAGVKKAKFLFDITDEANNLFTGKDLDHKAIEQDALNSIVDPSYLSESTNINKALMVHKLLNTDEIISKHPAEEIDQALNEIYAIAPTAAQYEPLMRAMLRKRLETGEQIDDFSLNQMIAMDEKMRDNTKELRIAPKIIGAEGENKSIYGG
jgi:hypothetical protein